MWEPRGASTDLAGTTAWRMRLVRVRAIGYSKAWAFYRSKESSRGVGEWEVGSVEQVR